MVIYFPYRRILDYAIIIIINVQQFIGRIAIRSSDLTFRFFFYDDFLKKLSQTICQKV
jgi:hypothetical protein